MKEKCTIRLLHVDCKHHNANGTYPLDHILADQTVPSYCLVQRSGPHIQIEDWKVMGGAVTEIKDLSAETNCNRQTCSGRLEELGVGSKDRTRQYMGATWSCDFCVLHHHLPAGCHKTLPSASAQPHSITELLSWEQLLVNLKLRYLPVLKTPDIVQSVQWHSQKITTSPYQRLSWPFSCQIKIRRNLLL